MNSGTVFEEIQGIETVEPAFGLPALWISEVQREQAELNGYTVVDAVSVLATHITEVIKMHADEILGRQETQNLVDNVKKTNASVVSELVPDLMMVGEIQKVLANLLSGKSIDSRYGNNSRGVGRLCSGNKGYGDFDGVCTACVGTSDYPAKYPK